MNNRQTASILSEIHRERAKQDQKWGPQNERDYDDVANPKFPHAEVARHERAICESATKAGKCSWEHIVDEEYAEACESAAAQDPYALRAELVQTAAVIVAWIESIDNRVARREGKAPQLKFYGGVPVKP